eukprot:gb/GECG01002908.1/.p1 GENE.gb/GECG01002908.1/~~gb/GECG01002908.1/.p1  ORF type:complete len:1074 (+),score=134.45 gb/GECG01002908.1/:1-3222(+)
MTDEESSRYQRELFPGAAYVGARAPIAIPSRLNTEFIAVACGKVVNILSAATGNTVQQLRGHDDVVTSVQYRPKEQLLYTASLDQTIRAWTIEDGRCIREFDLQHPLYNMVLSGSDQPVAYVCLVVLQPTESSAQGQQQQQQQQGHDNNGNPPSSSKSPKAESSGKAPELISKREEIIPPGSEVPAVQGFLPKTGNGPTGKLMKTKMVRYDLGIKKITKTLSKHKGVCTGLDLVVPPSTTQTLVEDQYSFVAYTVRKQLYVWNERSEKLRKFQYSKPLTSLAIHPELRFIATGDIEGQIIQWYVFEQQRTQSRASKEFSTGTELWSLRNDVDTTHATSLTSTKHWHAHACSCLSFTQDGAYMLSGGEEAVLVLWQIHGNTRTFLPRLGAPLLSLDSFTLAERHGSGIVYAIGLADSSLLITDASSMNRKWQLRYPAIASQSVFNQTAMDLKRGMVFDPRTGGILVNGFAGKPSLQLFSISREAFLAEFDIVSRNYISRTEKNPTPKIGVTHACLSSNGQRLATIDTLQDKHLPRTTLRFWEWNSRREVFELNTSIENPHEGEMVTALAYNPCKDAVITASSGGEFKMWDCRQLASHEYSIAEKNILKDSHASKKDKNSFAPKAKFAWHCRTAASYREHYIQDVAFSDDGSVVAVSYGDAVTLWDCQQCKLLQVLSESLFHSRSASKSSSRSISEGNLLSSSYRDIGFPKNSATIVAASDSQIVSWDLVSGKVVWSYEGDIGPVDIDDSGLSGEDGLLAVCIHGPSRRHRTSSTQRGTTRENSECTVMLLRARDPSPVFMWSLSFDSPNARLEEEKTLALRFVRPRAVSLSKDSGSAKRDTPNALLMLMTSAGRVHALSSVDNLARAQYGRVVLASSSLADTEKGNNPWQLNDQSNQSLTQSDSSMKSDHALRVLRGPIQSLPPLRDLASELLNAFIPSKTTEPSTGYTQHLLHRAGQNSEEESQSGSHLRTPTEEQVTAGNDSNEDPSSLLKLFESKPAWADSTTGKEPKNGKMKRKRSSEDEACKRIVELLLKSDTQKPTESRAPTTNGHASASKSKTKTKTVHTRKKQKKS